MLAPRADRAPCGARGGTPPASVAPPAISRADLLVPAQTRRAQFPKTGNSYCTYSTMMVLELIINEGDGSLRDTAAAFSNRHLTRSGAWNCADEQIGATK